MNSKPKYFGVYSGPSYTNYDREYMMAFSSLREARRAFEGFYNGRLTRNEYIQSPGGYYVPWHMDDYVLTPHTTREDWMDLYVATESPDYPGMYDASEDIEYRMTFGERGGIVVER